MNTQINIRKAEKSDINDILLIEALCFETDKFNKRQFMYLLSKSIFFVAKIKDKTVGYIILLETKRSKNLRLYSIAVHPEAQGKQIGQHLIDYAIQLAKSMNKQGINLEVRETNQTAIKLYKRNGFSFFGIKPAYYADGAHASLMKYSF